MIRPKPFSGVSPMPMRGKRLVLLGAGHAHLPILARLPKLIEAGVQVTVVGPAPFHYYSGMAPGLLSGRYALKEARFPMRCIVELAGGEFLEDTVTIIRATRRELVLASGATLPYDVASFNIGSEIVSLPGMDAGPAVFKVKPIQNVNRLHDMVVRMFAEQETVRVVVVGGGPAGVEMSGNLVTLAQRNDASKLLDLTLIAGSKVLHNAPAAARRIAANALHAHGVAIMEGERAEEITAEGVRTDSGRVHPANIVVLALGTSAPSVFKDSGLPVGSDGGLEVDDHLRCPDFPELLGGGDCVCPGGEVIPRVGVHAVREGPLLADNIETTLVDSGALKTFTPQQRFMLLYNLGDGSAVFNKWGVALRSRLFMLLKDYIDRGFMRSAMPGWAAAACAE
ncbi:pyridine nucleotide-disulfide oxidoreductase [Oceanidesulfovibrio marinus]|uniref:Pyridine nucleotide-disulfide oxidoreductase n=2 Tax=Oceanidesulfovibrio marinus TaxID=370038 RepID=A0ABX6NLQ3_9BACT|nr:pyridine nucleotide-disulfide oxidoreductase [Oceanidesulfovibrio marinus]